MNPDLAMELVDIALVLLKDPGSALETLEELIQRANQAYYDQAGKPLDPFLVLPEEPV